MNDLEYGPILCIGGPNKGRIGFFDDTDINCDLCESTCLCHDCEDVENCDKCLSENRDCQEYAIIYWGDMISCTTYELVPIEWCTSTISMKALISRIDFLQQKTARMKESIQKAKLLQELIFAKTLFYEKHIATRFTKRKGLKLFISYSSLDKHYANYLFADLSEAGHDPWIDDWNIRAGQSIPEEIQKGLESGDYIIVLLSPNSIKSKWVQSEWQSMYWDEMNNQEIKVIPVLLEDCEIPHFLKIKKYIDFRWDYNYGFDELLHSLQ